MATATSRRWSARVMHTSNALDLEKGVFAKRSKRRKSAPFRSAMSMLNFEINRAGRGMSASQRKVLERAKGELRRLYGKDPAGSRRRSRARKAHGRTRTAKGG